MGWAIVSVPGEHAAAVTRDAFAEGLNVFLYSDNVSLEDELALKRRAADLDLLLLGPDCGTAIIDGIGLGFANRVRRGRVGLVGASGTGLQLVAVALHRLGGGVSQAIGTGGRDLSREIGGATTLRALDRLERDADTDVIVLVSKRPAPEIARLVLAKANALAKPVVVYFQGADPLGSDEGHVAPSLEDAALRAQRLALGRPAAPGADRPPLPGGEEDRKSVV